MNGSTEVGMCLRPSARAEILDILIRLTRPDQEGYICIEITL